MRILLDAGADPCHTYTPYHSDDDEGYSSDSSRCDRDVGWSADKDCTVPRASVYACASGCVETVTVLLDEELRREPREYSQMGSYNQHLLQALPHPRVIDALVARGADLRCGVGILERNPLHVAAKRGYHRSIGTILRHSKMAPTATDRTRVRSYANWTAVHWAMSANHPLAVRELLIYGAYEHNDYALIRMFGRSREAVAMLNDLVGSGRAGDWRDDYENELSESDSESASDGE